ncbi:MAG: xylose isomerase [Methyloligellaceae bacterium]
MPETYFEDIPVIEYKGPNSTDPFTYKYYDRFKTVLGKSMEDHLRVAVCYWHSFCWDGSDVFGGSTFKRPWFEKASEQENADSKLDAAFEFFQKLGVPYFCFHDVDIMPPAQTAREHADNFAAMIDKVEGKMSETGIRLLWGTANVFGHPRYLAGAATNPDPDVFSYAAMQVRDALGATHRLNGENYVLWGGREGYETLLNTRQGQELDQLGRFLNMVVEHKYKIGYEGTILIEPKPHEPTKHQYDRDVATVFGFLKRYGLESEVCVNIEANHATLAGHSFEHEISLAGELGIFGSIDINRGDPQNGWDTDQFSNDTREVTLAIYYILKNGGFSTGGFNIDAKVRRQSMNAEDLFYGHIGTIDVMARSLLNAVALIEEGTLSQFTEDRYKGWKDGTGAKIMNNDLSLDELADHVITNDINPEPVSGRQEFLENHVSNFIR